MPPRPTGSITDLGAIPPARARVHRWRIRVQVAGRRHDVIVEGTRRDAEDRLDKLRTAPVSATRGGQVTVGELLERWLAHSADKLSPTTISRYRIIVTNHLAPIHRHRLDRLDVQHLDRLYASLLDSGLGPMTVRQVHAVIRRALVQARRWQLVERNVAEIATQPGLQQHEIVPPTDTQVMALLAAAAAHSPEMGALIRLAATLGARRAELVGLRWDELAPDGTIVVCRSIYADQAGNVSERPTKTRQTRRAQLDPDTVAMLDALPRSGPWVFGAGPLPWTPAMVSSRWRRVREAAALVDPSVTTVRLHDLRHWMVTSMLDAGVPLATVAARAGHADGNVTRAVYSHRSKAADAEAATMLGARLG